MIWLALFLSRAFHAAAQLFVSATRTNEMLRGYLELLAQPAQICGPFGSSSNLDDKRATVNPLAPQKG